MLVHYIYDTGLVLKIGEYFTLTRNQHVPVEDAIQKAFGMSAGQLDKTLHNYAASGHYKYYKLAAPAGIDAKAYTSTPLSALDAQALLGDVHLHSRDYQQVAVQEFEAVLKSDPNHAAALRGLGYSYLMKQELAKAGEYFHKSAQVNPNDPRVLYYSAMLYQREESSPGSNAGQMVLMQSELEQSVKLDPDFADAHNLLALAYRTQGKRDLAVASLRRAIDLNPRNEQYQFNLASLYLENQQFDDATSMLRSLQASNDPQVAERSIRELAQLQQYREQLRAAQPSVAGKAGNLLVNRSTSPAVPTETGNPKVAPAKFLHGKLVSVDCTGLPVAILTILEGPKTWKFRVANSKKTMLIGADELSCDWKGQKVAINYRETGDRQGDLISLEIQ